MTGVQTNNLALVQAAVGRDLTRQALQTAMTQAERQGRTTLVPSSRLWVKSQEGVGLALIAICERTARSQASEEAIEALSQALDEYLRRQAQDDINRVEVALARARACADRP